MQANLHKLFILLLIAAASMGLTAQTVITHNIATGNLIIAGNSTDNYIITGTTSTNYVQVQTGYKGHITLRSLSITLTAGSNPPIAVKGQNNSSNLSPVTNVDILLEGNNVLSYNGSGSVHAGCAALQVELGSQINISENPCYPGSLTATVTNSYDYRRGGAGIGAPNHGYSNTTSDATATVSIIGNYCTSHPISGGNIVISGGTITARGSHGAGIGGSYYTYYDGMIVVYGGTVNASSNYHAAGLGSGCPNGNGVDACYTSNSAIIVLPPAKISATGANVNVGVPNASLGLAGTNKLIYIGDAAKPLITVRTEDYEPYADIYVDLSLNPDIAGVFNAIIPSGKFDIRNVKFGQTNASGLFQFNGIFNSNTTFFTDATSSQSGTLGRPYLSETVQLSSGGTVILKRRLTNISMLFFSSAPLPEGYTAPQAFASACWIKIIYRDGIPMTNIVFDIAGGITSDYSVGDIKFYASDSITQIAPPTTLSQGDTIYAVVPLKTGRLVGYYGDAFRFIGNWNGTSTDYIRQAVGQHVYRVDTTKNICKGDSVLFSKKYYKETGYYYDTLKTIGGCDSMIAMHLVVNFSDTSIYDTICQGDSIFFGKRYYTQTGIYTDSLQMALLGCDSLVRLHLFVTIPPDTIIYDTIRQGQSVLFGGQYYSETGIYADTLQTVLLGCDSLTTLHLFVNPPPNTIIYDTICQGDSLLFGGQYYEQTGIYIDSLQTEWGYDSIATLHLLVNLPSETTIYDTVCPARLPYRLYGFDAADGGRHIRVVENAAGCDSTVTLYLTITDTIYRDIAASICDGEKYTKNGFNETKTGLYARIEKTAQGCDSIIRLKLTVNPYTDFKITATGKDFCEKDFIDLEVVTHTEYDSILWNTGSTESKIKVTEPGVYSVTVSLGDCQDTASHVIDECCIVFIPNAFTPHNLDGLNDVFKPYISCYETMSDYKMFIYDRWGNIVFKSFDYAIGWNGNDEKSSGYALGVYSCVVDFVTAQNKHIKKYTHVTLLK